MRTKSKTVLMLLLVLTLVFSMTVSAFAEPTNEGESDESTVTEEESIDLNDASISGITDKAYTGKPVTLSIKVSYACKRYRLYSNLH